jgi:hypothetical protein
MPNLRHLNPVRIYRIVSIIPNSDLSKISYRIERKTFFGWKEIKIKEDSSSRELSFGSLVEAEHYVLNNYLGHGVVYQPYPNVYQFKPYTYYV